MYDGLLTTFFDRLEKKAEMFYWLGYQNGIVWGAGIVLIIWFVSWYIRGKT